MTHAFSTTRNALLTGLIFLSMGSMPIIASAQGNPSVLPPGWGANNPNCNVMTGNFKASCIPMFIGYLVALVFSFISAFFILNVIYAGYQIALGSWTGEKSEGKDRLTWSIIGLVVCVCAYLILDLVVSIVTP